MAQIAGVYKIQNRINSRVYIGISNDLYHRRDQHYHLLRRGKSCNPHLQNSWNKYGENAFEFSPILYCEKFELGRYEVELIKKYSPNVYNISSGGEHPVMAESTKRKLSESQIGKFVSVETRKKLSLSHLGKSQSKESIEKRVSRIRGKHYSEEEKERMYASRRGVKLSEARKLQISEIVRKMWSNPQKRKERIISLRSTGRKLSEEAIKKIIKARTGSHYSEEAKENMKKAQRLRRQKEQIEKSKEQYG